MGPSCLNGKAAALTLDASVVINLNASGAADKILSALPNSVIVVDAVLDELEDASPSERDDYRLLKRLIRNNLIATASIEELQKNHFERLVLGSDADTLDDGEAATIAYAVERGAIAIIDERKALRICREQYPRLIVASTVDLLSHDSVVRTLGRKSLSEAVFSALIDGRMRVLPQHIDWVVDLIGAARASKCMSLPAHARGQPMPKSKR